MPLTSFASGNAVTAALLNPMVNDLPKLMVHSWMGDTEIDLVNTVGAVTTSYPDTPQLETRCEPLVGDYLRTLLEMRTDNAAKTIDVSVRVWRRGVEVELYTATVTSATAQIVSGLTSMTAVGALGDLTCEDVRVRFYFKSPAPAGVLFFVKSVLVMSGQAAALSSYLE